MEFNAGLNRTHDATSAAPMAIEKTLARVAPRHTGRQLEQDLSK